MSKKILNVTMIVCMMFVFMVLGTSRNAYANEDSSYGLLCDGEFLAIGMRNDMYFDFSNCEEDGTYKHVFSMFNNSSSSKSIFVSSSDTSILKIVKYSKKLPVGEYTDWNLVCKPLKPGDCKLTIKIGNNKYKISVFVHKGNPQIKSIQQTDYDTFKITCGNLDGYTGYTIKRIPDKLWEEGNSSFDYDDSDFEVIKTVKGGTNKTFTIKSKDWNKTYHYVIQARYETQVTNGSHSISLESSFEPFTLKKMSSNIISTKKSGDSGIKVTWEKKSKAKGYYLYRATSQYGTYKCIYKTKKTGVTSYTDKVSKGKTYYYKLKTIYPEFTSDYSDAASKMLPASSKKVNKSVKFKDDFTIYPQYTWNWAAADDVYYYTASGKMFTVTVTGKYIRVYKFDSAFKAKLYKEIKISYDDWGGFYHGTDGNFYIAIGYNNLKESKTKTVIKVIKYDKNWKKVKTANIKGGVSNVFEGIYIPFRAGNCSMDMKGSTLYIHTAREMFVHSDGLHHQSNISFATDTKTMKAKASNDSYVSHSFNQYVRFDNDNLYLVDHGDGYPRSVNLTIVKNYGQKDSTSSEYDLFNIKGSSGENYTGCTVGGMEVGKKNVMVCGTAQPHYFKIKGVSGMNYGYAHNVYLIVANKETGKKKTIWLTQNNPKTTKTVIGDTRMIKLDDNRFGIMYTTTTGNKSKLNYVVVDNDGKIIYTRTYSDMTFSGGTQPIIYNGRIVWIDSKENKKTYKTTNKIYAIPALLK